MSLELGNKVDDDVAGTWARGEACGLLAGVEDGKMIIPYFRFPGETTLAEGSARPQITDRSFTWQPKTGKRVTVYVTSDDGETISNRVTI